MSDEFGDDDNELENEIVAAEAHADGMPRALPWSAKEAIAYGWARVTRDPAIILVLAVGWLVMNAFSFLSNILQAATGDADGDTKAVVGVFVVLLAVANFFVSTYVTMGWITYLLKLMRGQPASLADIFSGGPYLRMLGATFVFSAVMVAACCALIVPGVIFALGCGLFGYLIMDQGAPAIESLGASWTLMRGHKGEMFVFMILAVLVTIAGLLLCGVGLFVAMPITSIAYAWIYMKLTGQEVMPLE